MYEIKIPKAVVVVVVVVVNKNIFVTHLDETVTSLNEIIPCCFPPALANSFKMAISRKVVIGNPSLAS